MVDLIKFNGPNFIKVVVLPSKGVELLLYELSSVIDEPFFKVLLEHFYFLLTYIFSRSAYLVEFADQSLIDLIIQFILLVCVRLVFHIFMHFEQIFQTTSFFPNNP